MEHNNIPFPTKKSILIPNKKPILLPNSSNKPILLPTPSTKPVLLPNPSTKPVLLPKSSNKLVILPNTTKTPLLPKSPNKSLIPLPRSPVAKTFTPEMINEDTILDFAISLNQEDFRSLIDFLSDYYYNEEALISDKKFDQLENIYKELYGEYQAEWPKVRGEKVLLPYHLSSLKKMIEENEINNWINKHSGPYLLQDKIDGITLLLVSEIVNGRRKISLFTHGDGVEGEDISHVLNYLSLPKIDYDIAIRGEGVYTLEVFEMFKDRFRNPRNMITGTLRAKKSFDPDVVRHLSFYAYQIRSEQNTPYDDIVKLQKLGFDVPVHKLVDNIDKDYLVKGEDPLQPNTCSLENYYLNRKQEAETEIDGIVVYQNIIIDYPEIKGKLPSQVIAFKTDTDAEIGETTVTEITWKASKHKKLKPVIHYDKVVFAAADLKRATGYNARYILNNNIGPGAVIRIKRSGDVIPKVIDVIVPAPNGPNLPDENIYGKYEWNANGVEIILLEDNDEVRTNKIKHFLTTLKVKKAGPERIASMVQSGIKTPKDLMNATPEQLSKLSGIGINLATQILEDLAIKINNVPLARILDASDIFPGIGERRFDEIIEVHPDLLNYSYDNPSKIVEMIKEIRGFGPKLSEIIGHNLATFVNWLYDNPSITIEKPKIIENERGVKLVGETIVITGFTDRDSSFKRSINSESGTLATSVSKNTTILVMKDLKPESFKGKGQKAVELNEKARNSGLPEPIRIMSKEEFLNEYF